MVEYDVSKVKEKLCISCHKPIGNKPFEEVRIFARFGQILFRHKECSNKVERGDHDQPTPSTSL